MVTVLGENHHVKTTTIQDGYNIKEEQDKFLWADVVIYQTPIYWFSVPGLFKTYMDEVYEYGLFFKGADEYGTGGLLKRKSICSLQLGMHLKKHLEIRRSSLKEKV